MCYPPCTPTYTALTSNDKCYEPCYKYYPDNGLTCSDAGRYWRPGGRLSKPSCEGTTHAEYDPALGCHFWATMWYIVCHPGYVDNGNSVMECWPDRTT